MNQLELEPMFDAIHKLQKAPETTVTSALVYSYYPSKPNP